MTAPDWLRPSAAAARFGVSVRTLQRWARAGLIGQARHGRIVHYPASDIADLIAAGVTPRTVAPATSGAAVTVGVDWREMDLWRS